MKPVHPVSDRAHGFPVLSPKTAVRDATRRIRPPTSPTYPSASVSAGVKPCTTCVITNAHADSSSRFCMGTVLVPRRRTDQARSAPCSIVELGCGEGRVGRKLLHLGHRVVG